MQGPSSGSLESPRLSERGGGRDPSPEEDGQSQITQGLPDHNCHQGEPSAGKEQYEATMPESLLEKLLTHS